MPQGILHRHLEPWLTDNYFVTRARAAKHVELAAIDRGCVKTRYRLDFGGASTIPGTKQIEYEASYEVVFNWHGLGSAFSHGLDLQETFVVLAAQRQFSEWSGRTARELTEYSSASAAIGGMRLESQHLFALPPFEVVRPKKFELARPGDRLPKNATHPIDPKAT